MPDDPWEPVGYTYTAVGYTYTGGPDPPERTALYRMGHDHALAAVRSDYDRVCAERDAAVARAEAAEADADQLAAAILAINWHGHPATWPHPIRQALDAHDAAVAQRGGGQ